ncbi:MAG TPA: hypothetical protein VGK82_03655 [Pyrinomonadaceae bacterium]
MSKRVSGSVLLLTTLAFSLIVGDVLARGAQDPQTQPATPQTQPTPTTKTKAPKRKRGQMKMNTPANETTTGDQTTPADTTMSAKMPMQNMSSMASTQTDLSGTYAGTFNCDALGLTGDTTLTINGNQFTTADGKTGRIVASTTHGYTAVALQTGEVPTGATTTTAGAAAATPPQIVSLRAHKSGNRLTLTSVPGATMPCSFSSSRNMARRSRQTPAAAGTTVASPAEAGATPTDVTTPAKPARNRRGNTRRTTTPTTKPTETPAQPTQPTPETPTPSQTPSPQPTQTPSPEPTQTPSPEPAPSPNPSPSGSPTPVPNPSPSPTTTPSPTPSPSPRPRG